MKRREPLLRTEGITKSFGSTVALDKVSIELYENEVLGMVGQNGSGKSTLTKILVGAERPDEGKIFLYGKPISPKNPKHAEELGISIAYQDSAVIPDLKVYEWLGLESESSSFRLDRSRMREEAKACVMELKIGCDPDATIKDLPIQTQKLIEIARSFLIARQINNDRGPIILLDEPTASLNTSQKEVLYDKISELKSRGSFIYISHIIKDILKVSDRVCVLRDGRLVKVFDARTEKLSAAAIHQAMIGRDLERTSLSAGALNEVILRVVNLTKRGVYSNVSFELYKGELLGIYGQLGSGKSELARTIAGLIDQNSGSIEKDGKPLNMGGVSQRVSDGVGYLSGNNRDELFLFWPVRKNISVANLHKIVRKVIGFLPLIDRFKEDKMAGRNVDALGIKTPSIHSQVNNLSGGNRQKLLLAKWVERGLDILVMENPTTGIDVGAREDFYGLLAERKRSNRSGILFSDDWEETNNLCDRIFYIEGGLVSQPSEEMSAYYDSLSRLETNS